MKFNYKDFFKSDFNIKDFFKLYFEEKKFLKENPDFFLPVGTFIFSGKQGSGKTLSAVDYVKKLKQRYPKALVVSNVDIVGIDVLKYNGINSLVDINNGENGVIYLIDEIHLEFNSLESKVIPIEVFTEISQQRKQRKHIIGTSQLFLRVAKPFREQVEKVIICKCYLSKIQYNIITDGETITTDKNGEMRYRPQKRQLFFHTKAHYESYDTFQKIKRYKKMNFKSQDLYNNNYFEKRGEVKK